MFKAHYLPHGRAAAEVGGTAMPQEVTLTPRSHSPTTDLPLDIPHGCEGAGRRTALPAHPALHAHSGTGSTPYPANPERALSSRSPPPGTEEGSYVHPRRCHSPAIGHLGSLARLMLPATRLLPSSEPPLLHHRKTHALVLAKASSAHGRWGLHICI